MGFTKRTERDIEKLLCKHSKLIVKKIEESSGEKPPGREFEVYLVEPKLPEDFKGFIQRLAMLINEMSATEITYHPEKNSMTFWYD
jgi:hypothetical protein